MTDVSQQRSRGARRRRRLAARTRAGGAVRGGRGGGARGPRCDTITTTLGSGSGEVCTGGKTHPEPRGGRGGSPRLPDTPAPRAAGSERRCKHRSAAIRSRRLLLLPRLSSAGAPSPLLPSLPPTSSSEQRGFPPPPSLSPPLPPSPSLPAVVVVIKVVGCVCVGHPAPPGAGGCWGRAGRGGCDPRVNYAAFP